MVRVLIQVMEVITMSSDKNGAKKVVRMSGKVRLSRRVMLLRIVRRGTAVRMVNMVIFI